MADDDDIESGLDTGASGGFDADIPLDDFDAGTGSSLADSFRNNPMMKVGVILGGFAAIVGGVVLFGGNDGKPKQSKDAPISAMATGTSTVTETPASETVSDAYRTALEDSNAKAVETAVKQGTSALPVPIATPVGRVSVNEEQTTSTEDPLERWRRIQDERQRREAQALQTATASLPGNDPNAEAVQALSQSMATQMQSILDAQGQDKKISSITISAANYMEEKRKAKAEEAAASAQAALAAGGGTGSAGTGAQSGAGAAGAQSGTAQQPVKILVPAGDIAYAQLLTEANSDSNTPVLGQIVSGPLSGSRMLGSFTEEDELLVLKFNTVIIDGIGHPMDTLALDPATTRPGMATDVDHHYFKRVVLPAAASFIEGFGSAIADSGTTTVSTEGATGTTTTQQSNDLDPKQELFKGIAQAATQVSQFIQDAAGKTEVTVKIAPGTPLGLLFLAPVTDTPAATTTAARSQ